MVKLSDALRGAADKAPLDGITVDASRTARRVSRSRGLRGASNGLLGAGAVALVAVAVVGPGSALTSGRDSSASTAGVAESAGGGSDAMLDGGLAMDTSLAWGLCGSPLPAMPEIALPFGLTATLPSPEAVDGVLAATATLTTVEDGAFETFGVDGVVLWDGIVVATLDGDPATAPVREVQTVTLSTGADAVTELSIPLENCWDGAALPAGSYQLVLTQELWAAAVVDQEPPVDPAASPEPAATEPASELSSVAPMPSTTDGDDAVGAPDAAVSSGEDTSSSTIAAGASTRVVAPAVDFAVPGDAVADPFAAYLGTEPGPEPTEPSVVVPGSDSALDAATARDQYLAGLTGAWDMAPGTQRWLATADGLGTVPSTWWGCGVEGDGRFPGQSSVMNLLAVDVVAPPSIDVSHGWVVEGNPEVRVSLTNTSAWDLTQFWGADSVNLLLVRDGRVVAEGYPVSPNPYSMGPAVMMDGVAAEGAASSSLSSMVIAPDGGVPVLPAGATVTAEFLWRDVNACWTDGEWSGVQPGTYTLLAMHGVSAPGDPVAAVTGGGVGVEPFVDEPTVLDGNGGGSTLIDPRSGSGTDVTIAPAPDAYDWFELQVWTSLGTITVR